MEENSKGSTITVSAYRHITLDRLEKLERDARFYRRMLVVLSCMVALSGLATIGALVLAVMR